jgi:uncharacterized membrane protein required for colicin V production
MNRNYIIGLILCLIPLPSILSYLNVHDLIDSKLAVTLVLVEVPIGLLFHFISKKHEQRNEIKYIPIPQNYWDHIVKLHKSLEEDLIKETGIKQTFDITTDSGMLDLFKIIKKSTKKREILQHLVTYLDNKNAEIPTSFFWSFIQTNIANNTFKDSVELREYYVKEFNKKFNHIFQIMVDSKPLVGLCDGCKMDYFGDDKKDCLVILNNFNREYEKGTLKKLLD